VPLTAPSVAPLGVLTAFTAPLGVLTPSVAPLGVLTASSAPGAAAAVVTLGLLDEAAAPVLDEAGGFILGEDGS
jgi:hypothetical protein